MSADDRDDRDEDADGLGGARGILFALAVVLIAAGFVALARG